MSNWFTTHWPPRTDDLSHSPGGVWVVDGKEHVIRDIAPGDLVWIYESRSGKTLVRQQANGGTQEIPCQLGRQGVIALCRVVEPAYECEDTTAEVYADGKTMWWRWYAPTESLNTSGFVPRKDAAVLLGFSPNYPFRGFGRASSGVKRLTPTQHDGLLRAFRASAITEQRRRLGETSQAGHGMGGEGPLHKHLKESIAADPRRLLGEDGLSLVKLEYPFPTGDRIDVLLRDQFGRFVAVEVEPACSKDEVCGPLQCMKYRAMLSYIAGVPVQEIRTILASPDIHPVVQDRCRKNDVEIAVLALDADG